MTFEEKMTRLEEIAASLENSKLGLDESIKLYQEGKKLQKELDDELNSSIKKASFMVENDTIVPFEEEAKEKEI